MEKRFLIARWLRSETAPIPIYDEASVSSVRQRVRDTGAALNLPRQLVENLALISSELTHNQLSHAKQGYFAINPIERHGRKGIEVIAADIGPGIEMPGLAIQDGVSTTGGRSLGAGLGSVQRIADELEFDNRMLEGARIVARKFDGPRLAPPCEVAIMGHPYPGEIISGDDGVFLHSESGLLAAVCDGLGHGPEAREASNRAIETVIRESSIPLEHMIHAVNDALASTRGSAMSIARVDHRNRMLECASLGDVHAHLYNRRDAHFFTSTPMVLGTGPIQRHRIRVEKVSLETGSILVLFTDGLKSKTSLKGRLDILRQPVISIAQHLLENDSRPDDDALVLVARIPA